MLILYTVKSGKTFICRISQFKKFSGKSKTMNNLNEIHKKTLYINNSKRGLTIKSTKTNKAKCSKTIAYSAASFSTSFINIWFQLLHCFGKVHQKYWSLKPLDSVTKENIVYVYTLLCLFSSLHTHNRNIT